MIVWASLVVILCFIWKIKSRQKKNEPPLCDGALPFVGHIHQLIGSTEEIWKKLKSLEDEVLRKGPLSIQLGWHKFYVVGDPESFEAVSKNCLEKSDLVYKLAKELTETGLFIGKVPVWRPHRKILNPLFHQNILDGYVEIFNEQAMCIIEDLRHVAGKGFFDVLPYLKRLTLRTVCLTMADIDIEEQEVSAHEYATALSTVENCIIERLKRIWLYNDKFFRKSAISADYFNNLKTMHSLTDKIVHQRRQVFASHKTGDKRLIRNTVVDMLLKLENTAMTMKEIKDEINSSIMAGFDTSSMALMYILVMLGSYPEAQAKALHEIEEVCGSGTVIIDRPVTSRLPYVKAIIKETIRIFPLITFIPRKIDKTIELSNSTLYKGHNCILMVKALHRHPLWGDDIEEFKPERWLNRDKTKETSSIFAGFGLGRRNCIGKNYALMFLEIILIYIIKNYKIIANHKNLVHKLGIVLTPISGHYISLQRR